MKRNIIDSILLITLPLAISLAPACTAKAKANSNRPVRRPDHQPLDKTIRTITSSIDGRVGVAARILETGESVSFNPDERFPMQSVYKLPIGMTVLRLVDEGKFKLDQKIRIDPRDFIGPKQHSPIRDKNPAGVELSLLEVLRFAMSESDGTASDVLMKLCGGSEGVRAYLDEIQAPNIVVANTEKEIGLDNKTQYLNWATPVAAVEILGKLQSGKAISDAGRAVAMKFLIETKTGKNRLKALLPPGTIIAHKTGTSNTVDGVTAATNDIGIITLPDGRHLAIAVFVSDSKTDESGREGAIAKIARAIWNDMTAGSQGS